jgi:hypothetical protein
MKNEIRYGLLAVLGLCLLAGCDEKDQYRQVAEVAREAADRQAQQNDEMARLNREVVEGTRQMIEADTAARKDAMAVQHEIQAERVTLNDGFDKLEGERKEIAQERRTESVLVPAFEKIGGALVAIAVVVLCLVLLIGQRNTDKSDAELNELLICDLASEQPQLLHGRSTGPILDNNLVNNDSPSTLLPAPAQDPEESPPKGDTT